MTGEFIRRSQQTADSRQCTLECMNTYAGCGGCLLAMSDYCTQLDLKNINMMTEGFQYASCYLYHNQKFNANSEAAKIRLTAFRTKINTVVLFCRTPSNICQSHR